MENVDVLRGMVHVKFKMASRPGYKKPELGLPTPTLQTVDRVRNYFPETWLWTQNQTRYYGC